MKNVAEPRKNAAVELEQATDDGKQDEKGE